jgi:NAD(P)H-dependent flavin oxidoreductase YrpB (nitropropane dioxygenase family)
MWHNERLIDLFGIEVPIIQAPMAGSAFSDLVVAVSEAGGLGSLACGLLSVEQAFGGQARRLFPRLLLWMKRAGLRIRDATQSSPRVTRPVGTEECF